MEARGAKSSWQSGWATQGTLAAHRHMPGRIVTCHPQRRPLPLNIVGIVEKDPL